MNLPWIKTCKKCGKTYDYQECPYCRKEKEEVEDAKKSLVR